MDMCTWRITTQRWREYTARRLHHLQRRLGKSENYRLARVCCSSVCTRHQSARGIFCIAVAVSRSKGETDPASVAAVALVSTYGQIRLRLRRDWAPQACDAVAALAAGALRACSGCSFYRHEPVPQGWGVNGFNGPPYALLQGGLPVMPNKVPMENSKSLPVRRGTAAFISDTADFFIGTADHTEWGAAFTVFAEVLAEDMTEVVSRIPEEPYRNSTDSNNITTRWLMQTIPFRLQPLRLDELPPADAGAINVA